MPKDQDQEENHQQEEDDDLEGVVEGEFGKWYPVVRISRTIPFGYKQDPNDPDMLLPILRELELLEVAKQHVRDGYSLRQVADWLSAESGRSISHSGFKKRVETEAKRRRGAQRLHYFAKRYKEAYEKALKWDQKLGGEGTRDYYKK